MEYYSNDYSEEELVFNELDEYEEDDDDSSVNTLERSESILGTSMTSDGRFVVGDDDIRVIELLGKCAALKRECETQRQKKEKARAKSHALAEHLKELKSKLNAERRRNTDLEKSLANKDRELVEVLGNVHKLERLVQTGSGGSVALHKALSSTLQQEKQEFETKKTKAARSKTKLTQELQNLWLKYEALRQSYEMVEAQCAKLESQNTTYALRQQESNAVKEELIQKNTRLDAKLKSLEESLIHMREEQESLSIRHTRRLTAVQGDLEQTQTDLEKNLEATQHLRKQSFMMASKLLDFQYRQSLFELPIRKWVVEQLNPIEQDQNLDVQLTVIKFPATKDLSLRIRQNTNHDRCSSIGSHLSVGTRSSIGTRPSIGDPSPLVEEDQAAPTIPYEFRFPMCEILEIRLLDHRRFRISTEKENTFTFTSANATSIVDDLLEIKRIDLTPEVHTSPPTKVQKPKTNVAEALTDLFDL